MKLIQSAEERLEEIQEALELLAHGDIEAMRIALEVRKRELELHNDLATKRVLEAD